MTVVDLAVTAWRLEADQWGCRNSTDDPATSEIFRHADPGIVSPVVMALVAREKADATHRELRDCASMRAAIGAMREPTVAMIKVGNNETNCGGPCGNASGKLTWQVMIDAALSEGGSFGR